MAPRYDPRGCRRSCVDQRLVLKDLQRRRPHQLSSRDNKSNWWRLLLKRGVRVCCFDRAAQHLRQPRLRAEQSGFELRRLFASV